MSQESTYNAFLMDHASGALRPGMALLAEEHLRLNGGGRHRVALWSALGGALFESVAPQADQDRKSVRRSKRGASQKAGNGVRYDFEDMRWRTGWSGVSYARGELPGTRYMKLEAGGAAPSHGHSALEATLVLSGELGDGNRVYHTGDIAFGVPGEHHRPAAIGAVACVCFVALDPKPFWRFS